MPEGVVDSLVIATTFDESGLDRSTTAALNRIQRFTAGVRSLWRRLDDLRMADLGRTDPMGPS